ncbi:MAG: hypothetical protein RLN92_17785, partial [Alloalcanivorax xenomutans]
MASPANERVVEAGTQRLMGAPPGIGGNRVPGPESASEPGFDLAADRADIGPALQFGLEQAH